MSEGRASTGNRTVIGFALELAEGMGYHVLNGADIFKGGLGFAGQDEDESLAGDAGEGPGKDGERGGGHGAHALAEPGEFTSEEWAQGFGGDVARADTGPAGDEDEAVAFLGEFEERLGDGLDFVRDDYGRRRVPSFRLGVTEKGWAGLILIDALTGAVGYHEKAGCPRKR
jgi:hypothetical protein